MMSYGMQRDAKYKDFCRKSRPEPCNDSTQTLLLEFYLNLKNVNASQVSRIILKFTFLHFVFN